MITFDLGALIRRPFTVEHRTHGACRECDDAQRQAVTYAEDNNMNAATAYIETRTPKGTARGHAVTVRRNY